MPPILVEIKKIRCYFIAINGKEVKWYTSSDARWWTDGKDQRIDLTDEEKKAIVELIRATHLAQKKWKTIKK